MVLSKHFLRVFHQTESEVTTELTLAIPTSGVMSAFLTHHICYFQLRQCQMGICCRVRAFPIKFTDAGQNDV